MSRVITMKVIAARAGVTAATVSMSLANNPRISLVTRDKVRAIAHQLGYRPNPYLSALMSVRRKGRRLIHRPTLALVNCLESRESWRTTPASTVRQMREGAMERAAERGYRGEEFWLHQHGMTNQRFSEMLFARGIQGVLLGPLADDAPAPVLLWHRFAVVSLSVPRPDCTIATVCHDHYSAALQVMRECHRHGYRRPGLVLRRVHRDRFHGRWDAGFQIAPHLLPSLSSTEPLMVEDWNQLSKLPRWLKSQKPDVIVSPGAEPLHDALRVLGWRIPHSIGLVGLACSELDHPVSGIYQNGKLIGGTAIDILIGMIERNERGLPLQAMTQMIGGIWNPGQTLQSEFKNARVMQQEGAAAP